MAFFYYYYGVYIHGNTNKKVHKNVALEEGWYPLRISYKDLTILVVVVVLVLTSNPESMKGLFFFL